MNVHAKAIGIFILYLTYREILLSELDLFVNIEQSTQLYDSQHRICACHPLSSLLAMFTDCNFRASCLVCMQQICQLQDIWWMVEPSIQLMYTKMKADKLKILILDRE